MHEYLDTPFLRTFLVLLVKEENAIYLKIALLSYNVWQISRLSRTSICLYGLREETSCHVQSKSLGI